MGREGGSWMRDVWQDAREFRHCRKVSSGRDARWWDDHTCTMASRSIYTDGTHGVGAGNGVKRVTSFAKFLTVHIIHGSVPSETSPMWKPTTGEPCAGKPPARFGGRGGESLPYPYQWQFDIYRSVPPLHLVWFKSDASRL